MNLLEYWKKRCELAEAYIEGIPCDPDIYKEQLDAWNNWLEFKKLRIHDVVGRNEQLSCAYCEEAKPLKYCQECWDKLEQFKQCY